MNHATSTILTRQGMLVLAFVLLSSTAAHGQTDARPPADDSDLREQVQSLKSRVEAQDREIALLRHERDDQWLTEQRAEQIRALVQDVLADADTRASLLVDGMTAGHNGKNFFLGSADGNFLMTIGGFVQTRYIYNHRDDTAPPGDDDEFGFQIRRAKLQFGGHVVSPKFTYFLQVAGNRDSGAVDLEVATIGYKFSDTLALKVGRYKAGFLLEEEDVGATRQLAVERSLVNAIFTVHYVEGAELLITPNDWLRVHASINDGLRSGDVGGVGNDFQNDASDLALTGRAELKLTGDWKQVSDFAAWSGDDPLVFFGGGLHYEVAETGDSQTASPGVDDFLIYTVDGQYKANGFSAFAAFMGRHTNVTDGAATGDLDDFGFVAQAGYAVIPDKFAPFIRYEWISPDDNRGFGDMNLITVGANYYIHKHSIKWTNDIVFALDELNPFAFSGSRTGLGLLPDAPGEDGQIVFRSQLQLIF